MSYFFSLTLKMNFLLSTSEGGAYPSTQDAEAGQSPIPDQLNYTVNPGVTVKLSPCLEVMDTSNSVFFCGCIFIFK